MFSLGEIVLTTVVAAIVLGPKRLPEAAFYCGLLMRKMKGWLQPLNETIETAKQQAQLHKNQQRAATAEQQYSPKHD